MAPNLPLRIRLTTRGMIAIGVHMTPNPAAICSKSERDRERCGMKETETDITAGMLTIITLGPGVTMTITAVEKVIIIEIINHLHHHRRGFTMIVTLAKDLRTLPLTPKAVTRAIAPVRGRDRGPDRGLARDRAPKPTLADPNLRRVRAPTPFSVRDPRSCMRADEINPNQAMLCMRVAIQNVLNRRPPRHCKRLDPNTGRSKWRRAFSKWSNPPPPLPLP